ncbi:sigma-54-dependent transcriptional regulator [Desulfurivibrio alkaliphilus]|uniref:Two component, sigma54 specific, transcriptional regulator, Fis family n=1 Tax=Desulfurivibrio alkaliphilus (strain DSM 19089 / UNIQEM U267 / AHT2) TaxID=589865 RepID=D6Z198_DESAT|nr:sigma-54 dependent transcriptional regulator [Desulfurivibrio alkaliphilus]ADH85353.1 two component, sigma54 specific, transcriptional regulator, Fis family [Desulfurivibrio alkaliphilus AHT 2]
MEGRILIIDDEASIRKGFGLLLTSEGLTVASAGGGPEGLALLERESFDIVLLDFAMPELDGLEVLRRIKRLEQDPMVIMITGYDEVALAVEAIKEGAYDYLLKPPDPDHLLMTLRRALDKIELEKKVCVLDRSLAFTLENQLGKSAAMAWVIAEIKVVAASDFSLIIEGETGTGKSFAASLIHNLSARAAGPFIALDMGSIPETLLESELFGHRKGAFTGAERSKPGYFELAKGGTLLLDELQNLSPGAQAKILQVVEEKKFYPVGSDKPVKVDLRIIGASNSDLRRAVESGEFRRDLYYRLNEYSLLMPPLRERPEDIAFLATRLLSAAAVELNRNLSGLSDEALALLAAQPWPGNVRELKNVVRRAALLSSDGEVGVEQVSQGMQGVTAPTVSPVTDFHSTESVPVDQSAPLSLEESEKLTIARALRHTASNRTKAAAILGITHKTLLAKIKKYNLEE